VLRAEPSLRSGMVLATKGGIRPPLPYDQSPDYLASAIDASLQRLGAGVDCRARNAARIAEAAVAVTAQWSRTQW
jgi:hypothetical protein